MPQSTRTLALSVSIKNFEPVTVPTPPQNEIVAKNRSLLSQSLHRLRNVCGPPITKPDEDCWNKQREIPQCCGDAELARDYSAEASTFEWLTFEDVNVIKCVSRKREQQQTCAKGADTNRAWPQQQDRNSNLDCYPSYSRGPRPSLVVEPRRT